MKVKSNACSSYSVCASKERRFFVLYRVLKGFLCHCHHQLCQWLEQRMTYNHKVYSKLITAVTTDHCHSPTTQSAHWWLCYFHRSRFLRWVTSHHKNRHWQPPPCNVMGHRSVTDFRTTKLPSGTLAGFYWEQQI